MSGPFKIAQDLELDQPIVDERIAFFYQHFQKMYRNEGHFALACHAALPLAITPELLYQIRSHFSIKTPGKDSIPARPIPFESISDILLSPLCKEVRTGIFEMDKVVRDYLLENLSAHQDYKEDRLKELARFLFAYAAKKMGDPARPKLKETQQLAALTYLNKDLAVQYMVDAFNLLAKGEEEGELLRMTNIIEMLDQPLDGHPEILNYAKALNADIRGDYVEARASFERLSLKEEEQEEGKAKYVKIGNRKLLINRHLAKYIPKEEREDLNDEKLAIKIAYRNLLKSIKVEMDDADRKLIRRAFELAVEMHIEQRQRSGEPYVLQLIEVARICAAEIGLGPTAIASALLQDVLPGNPNIKLDQLSEQFGDRISKIVKGVNELDDLTYLEGISDAEKIKRVLRLLVEDVRIVLIKMAQRLASLRTIGTISKSKQLSKYLKIASETSSVYIPLAYRVGLNTIGSEFQDLCMKVTNSNDYYTIAKKLAETKRNRTNYINHFSTSIHNVLTELSYPYQITGRPKSIYSVWDKMKKKKIPFEEVYDLFSISIIIDVPQKEEKQHCWQVYSIVTDLYQPVPERLKDWITTPKSNGYESLHTTVIGPEERYVEIQIKSERMHETAERGIAAEWKYRESNSALSFSEDLSEGGIYENWLDNIRNVLDNNDIEGINFSNDLQSNLFAEEVYVYTPRGEMIILPNEATALDFAFRIHTDVGYHCSEIKIEGKVVPLDYKLQNGDQVSVSTSQGKRPQQSWMSMVVTDKAKNRIRTFLKEEYRREAKEGKIMLDTFLTRRSIVFGSNLSTILLQKLDLITIDTLYIEIARKEISLATIHREIESILKTGIKDKLSTPVEKHKKEEEKSAYQQLLISGEPGSQYDYTFAACCRPKQGDDIFAYLSANSGVKIHRTDCPNAKNLITHYGYRIMKAEWKQYSKSHDFEVELLIKGTDGDPGVIENLAKIISADLGMNMRSFKIDGSEGYFEAKIVLLISNEQKLIQAINHLETQDYIQSVEKVN